ncbi:MAG: carbamoyltransferase [Patescibacteria group bacterium]
MKILGISAYYHDSAACLVIDGRIVAAAQEERFTRKKHDHSFPQKAISYCLAEAGITATDLDYVAFYDKPLLKFERLLESYIAYAPQGFPSFLKAIPLWIKQKLWIQDLISKELDFHGKILFPEHHESHAASAFFPSPFADAAILTMDGVGEWSTLSYGVGEGNHLELLADIRFPTSLGLLYSAFTYYLGFKVNSGEYKVMGLAPYGEPKYRDIILEKLIDLKDDGSFRMDMSYFNYVAGLTMTSEKFHKLLGAPPRSPESELTQYHMDIARSLQDATEEIVLRIARHVRKETGKKYLCLAGGVALNCVANGKLLRENIFDDIWIQPASGDAGGALGAALAVWYQYLGNVRQTDGVHDAMQGTYLGPQWSRDDIRRYLDEHQIIYREIPKEDVSKAVARLIAEENVIGLVQGRMEFGPRALGCRSIIGDARSSRMQEVMNVKIKFRESFRPFAPSILAERVSEYFEIDRPSPYMLLVAAIAKKHRHTTTPDQESLFGLAKLKVSHSDIPAVTHVDWSARVQTVHRDTNPAYYDLIKAFEIETGCPVIINTSFNVRGEPIVASPEDAYRCFMRTGMDYLVLENFLLAKQDQPKLVEQEDWKKTYELD